MTDASTVTTHPLDTLPPRLETAADRGGTITFVTGAADGPGYTTEAVKGLISWALRQKDIYRVWAVCDVDNAASARVMEKSGMQREGILRRWSLHPNISPQPRDSYCYAIVK